MEYALDGPSQNVWFLYVVQKSKMTAITEHSFNIGVILENWKKYVSLKLEIWLNPNCKWIIIGWLKLKLFSFFVSKIKFDMNPMGKNIFMVVLWNTTICKQSCYEFALGDPLQKLWLFFYVCFFVVDWKYKMDDAIKT